MQYLRLFQKYILVIKHGIFLSLEWIYRHQGYAVHIYTTLLHLQNTSQICITEMAQSDRCGTSGSEEECLAVDLFTNSI